MSAARPKIADYPFTTLTPSWGWWNCRAGVCRGGYPRAHQGAHEGAGLGLSSHHVERTRLLVHLIDGASPIDRGLSGDQPNRAPRAHAKPQIVAVNKMDLPDAHERYDAAPGPQLPTPAGYDAPPIMAISAVTEVQELLYAINAQLQALPAESAEERWSIAPRARAPRYHHAEAPDVPPAGRSSAAQMTDWNSEESVERRAYPGGPWHLRAARGGRVGLGYSASAWSWAALGPARRRRNGIVGQRRGHLWRYVDPVHIGHHHRRGGRVRLAPRRSSGCRRVSRRKLCDAPASAAHRLRMVEIMASNAHFRVSTMEIERDGPSPRWTPCRPTAAAWGRVDLYFIMGTDSLRVLAAGGSGRILSLCRLVVASRPECF